MGLVSSAVDASALALLPERTPLFGRLASGTGVGTFWHVTDWHVNEYQPPTADAKDMCRTAAAGPSAEQPGRFGHPDCDPTPAGWQSAIAGMLEVQPSPDFIFAGGDWFGHVAKQHEGARAVRSSALMIATLLERSFPGAPVLHAIGNHDTWPYYSQAPQWRTMERDWTEQLGPAYISRAFPGDALGSWRRGGYFARALSPGLKAVVLNTNQLALGGGAEQLSWLADELAEARRGGQRVLLMGHIPPGPSHCELDSICLPGHYYQRAGGACWQRDAQAPPRPRRRPRRRPRARPRALRRSPRPSPALASAPLAVRQARLLSLLRSYADVVPASLWGHHHTESMRVLQRKGVAARRRPRRHSHLDHHETATPTPTTTSSTAATHGDRPLCRCTRCTSPPRSRHATRRTTPPSGSTRTTARAARC